MRNLKNEFTNLEAKETIKISKNVLKNKTQQIDINSLLITPQRLKNVKKLEFFIDSFLAKGVITGFYGSQGIGKSMFLISLCQYLLINTQDLKILYFDAENTLETLKARGIDFLLSNFAKRFSLINGEDGNGEIKCKPREFPDRYEPEDKNTLIILDSLRDFYPNGLDMNKDNSVDIVFDKLKRLRNASAGVIFLHHTTKRAKDEDGIIQPKGSGAIADNCDYYVQTQRVEVANKAILLFEITHYGKARGAFKPKAFEIPSTDEQMCEELKNSNIILKEHDYIEYCMEPDENYQIIKDSLIEILSFTKELNQRELMAKIKKETKIGDNKIFMFLKNFGKYFCDIKRGEKNAKIYSLKEDYHPLDF